MPVDLAVAIPAFLDLTVVGLDVPPELGEERFASDLRRSPGGGAITAVGGARLGLSTALVAALGDDLAAELIRQRRKVLSHCGLGLNRSALMAGVILNELGMPGSVAVERLRERRPGALFNDQFAQYLASLPGRP